MMMQSVREEAAQHKKEEEEKFNNMWFELKPNSFSTAIWALLVLDFDATGMSLFSKRDSDLVPHSQRWELFEEEKGFGWKDFVVYPFYWYWKRFWPFFSAFMFQATAILLFLISLGIQFGFTYLLYLSLDMPDFEAPGVEYICATTGWLQLISIGFFCAYMLGEVPRLFKVQVLILSSEFETSTDRGQADCKMLWADNLETFDDESYFNEEGKKEGEPGKQQDLCHRRSKSELNIRRFFATIVNLCDLGITGFVLFVGVRYIFWSGYKSTDPNYLTDAKYAPFTEDFGFPVEDGKFPWNSDTSGIEEVIMATLALVFIMDIDELLFAFLLPRSIQQVVEDCRLSSVMWMPSSFDADDFRQLGLPVDPALKLFRFPAFILTGKLYEDVKKFKELYDKYYNIAHKKGSQEEAQEEAGDQQTQKGLATSAAQKNAEKNEGMKAAYENKHRELLKTQLNFFEVLNSNATKFIEFIDKNPAAKDDSKYTEWQKAFKIELSKCLAAAKKKELQAHFNLAWMKIMPFATVCWIFVLMAIGFGVVLMVRHYEGCASFGSREMPKMPTDHDQSDYGDWAVYMLSLAPGGITLAIFVILLLWEFFRNIWGRKHPGRGNDSGDKGLNDSGVNGEWWSKTWSANTSSELSFQGAPPQQYNPQYGFPSGQQAPGASLHQNGSPPGQATRGVYNGSAAPQVAARGGYATTQVSQDQGSVMQLAGSAEPAEWAQLRLASQTPPASAQAQGYAQPQLRVLSALHQ